MTDIHARMASIERRDGVLVVNGVALTELTGAAGGTPFYAYDRAHVAARVAALRAALPARLRLHYAVKANPLPTLLAHLAGLVDGFDVASAGELRAALAAGMAPAAVSFAGPGKREHELAAALDAGVVVAVESPGEFQRLARMAAGRARPPSVVLRLNPDFSLKRAGMSMAGGPSPFGMDVDQARQLLAAACPPTLDIIGVQVFAGSQSLSAEAILACQEATLALAAELAPLLPGGLRYLNLGGGLGIPYFPGEQPLDLAALGKGLSALAARHADLFATTEVVLELGRYLVGEAGYYVCAVVDVKQSRGRRYAVVDGGLHQHLANSGNLGQVLRRNYPVVAGVERGAARQRVTVVGPLCTPLDVVADEVDLPPLAPGDLVVVLQSGAYGASASPTAFLGHPPPVELLV